MLQGTKAIQHLTEWRDRLRTVRIPIVLLACTLFIVGMAWSIRNLGLSPERINVTALVLLLCLSPFSLMHSGLGLQIMARAAGSRISFGKSITTSAVAILAETLPIPGGAIVRTRALMKAGVKLGKSSTLVLLTAALWIALGALGAGLATLGTNKIAGWALVAFGLGGSIVFTSYLWWQSGWYRALLMLAHRLSGIALVALRLCLAFRVLGVPLSFLHAMPFVLATIAGSAAAIVPAGLGVSEALAALAAKALVVPPAAGFLAVGIDRIVHLVISAVVSFHTALKPMAQFDAALDPRGLRLAVWGTYDTGKPRVRMLIEAARTIDPHLTCVNRNPWAGIEDKSQIFGMQARLKIGIAWMASYPLLLFSYLRMPKHDVVIVPYLGNIDVLLLWPLARLRGTRICWDMFISLYDTAVEDRRLVQKGSWTARLLYRVEWVSVHVADVVLMDTAEHARYVATLYRVPGPHVQVVWVGAETGLFRKSPLPIKGGPIQILFYGQFIPLHGLETLLEGIRLAQARQGSPEMHFTIIGTGQEAAKIDKKISSLSLQCIQRIDWVDYADLPERISQADICLGIFAAEGKAGRVIPNKVFQILAVGRPLITRDSAAIRELVQPSLAIRLVDPEAPEDLAEQLVALSRNARDPMAALELADETARMPVVGIDTIASQLRNCLNAM